MTEAEMKQTWCPDARAESGPDEETTANRAPGNKPDIDCLCLGRQCSAWRWDDVPNPAYAEWRKTNEWRVMADWATAPPPTIKSTTDGYCGRAGRP